MATSGPRHIEGSSWGRARGPIVHGIMPRNLRSTRSPTMAAPVVTYAADDRVGIVTLNRPEKLNAITPELRKLLVKRFHEADADTATHVVVLRAEGRSFCAGYDIGPNPARATRRGNALAWHESL